MRPARIIGSLAPMVFASIAAAATVDFESVPAGTRYGGTQGDTVGKTVLVEDGISMSLQEFMFDSFVAFNEAEVGGPYERFFESTPLQLNNISVAFDFSALGNDPTLVTLGYQAFGGTNNFSVNGSGLFSIVPTAGEPFKIAPGVLAFATDSLLTLEGPVQSLQVGGQELVIDDLVAIPEPTTAILLVLGVVGFGWWHSRRKHARRPTRPSPQRFAR